ncbi:MAG: pilin [Pseudomonas sp.]|nr:pilin [Pseudomonas sp.]
MSAGLKTAIAETFQSKGPSDMTCTDAATCGTLGASPLDATTLAGNLNVNQVVSDATGVITISYKPAVVPAGAEDLVVAPVDAAAAALDLSSVANAGAQLSWVCGTGVAAATTTVEAKFRPGNCR